MLLKAVKSGGNMSWADDFAKFAYENSDKDIDEMWAIWEPIGKKSLDEILKWIIGQEPEYAAHAFALMMHTIDMVQESIKNMFKGKT